MSITKKKPEVTREQSSHPLANCRPRGDRVVVKRDAAPDTSKGGIILPNLSTPKQQIGTVYAVGPGTYGANGERIPLDLKVGDRVVLTGYAGLAVSDPLGGIEDEYIILREDDVLAVLL